MDQDFMTALQDERVYRMEDLGEFLEETRKVVAWTRRKDGVRYLNLPAAFDIETSSFYRDGVDGREKVGIMYEWTLGIYGRSLIGRTWEEYDAAIAALSETLGLDAENRILVYVHNLGFEFGFLSRRYHWEKVFAASTRQPIYVVCGGVEYRCSLILSGYSLQKVGEHLLTYPVTKLVGDLDYSKIRHSGTLMSDRELLYCSHDVKVVMAYIMEEIERTGDISRIPLTKTGYVRRYCRDRCFYNRDPDTGKVMKDFKRWKYRQIVEPLTLTVDEYKQLKRAFQGGFTHASPFWSGKVVEDVWSMDFTSSYPYCMISEQYPMGAGEIVEVSTVRELLRYCSLYCCVFDVQLDGLESRLWQDSWLSESRCWDVRNATAQNGRIVRADSLRTTLTNVDFEVVQQWYTWDAISVGTMHIYPKTYLPTDLIKAVLDLYRKKTELKGVRGKEAEYLASKEQINSVYGMCVTDIAREECIFDGEEWRCQEPDVEKAIEAYNGDRNRFLSYPFGVFVTAYARRNLATAIVELGSDYIYSDTDSVKYIHPERHAAYFEAYDRHVEDLLRRACRYHDIDFAAVEPMTIKGVRKRLGVWDLDAHYARFKTLGAKRYMVEYAGDDPGAGEISLTVSGINKRYAVPYLLDKYGDHIFDAFDRELHIPAGATGKSTHTYIDTRRTGKVQDYLGVWGEYDELSGIHLEEADYTLSQTEEYISYIMSMQSIEGGIS